MTREEFTKRSFKAYMEVMYCHPRQEPISCMLLAVDFDRDTCFVQPLDMDKYEPDEYWVSREYVQFPSKKRMRVL